MPFRLPRPMRGSAIVDPAVRRTTPSLRRWPCAQRGQATSKSSVVTYHERPLDGQPAMEVMSQTSLACVRWTVGRAESFICVDRNSDGIFFSISGELGSLDVNLYVSPFWGMILMPLMKTEPNYVIYDRE